jgi:hypothetical protein
MHTNLQASADAAAEQAAARAKYIAAVAKMVETGQQPLDGLSPATREAVETFLAGSRATPARFYAKQDAEKAQFFRELRAQGVEFLRISQNDHDFIFDSILNTVDAGTKPAVKPMLREYGERQGYAPDWAERVATRTSPKRVRRSLKAKQSHPVIRDLKDGHMFTQTHQSALQSATYSGLAALLFSGSQSTREKRAMQARMDALEARLAAAEAEAARAIARLEIKDAGRDWKERARAILVAEPGMSKRELARRVGVHESTVRKYLAEIH